MKINNIVLIILSIAVIYLISTKNTEKMSNTNIDKRIKDIYQADIQSIRNLSKLANDLTTNGKLVVPGGLEIQGKIKMKGLELYPDSANCLVVKNSNGYGALGSRNKYYFHIDTNKDVYFYKNSYFKGDIKGLKDVKVDGKIKGENLEIKKDSYFGTAGHKLGIIWASGDYGAYFSFYKGGKRTFYMLPYTNGLLYNNGNFASEGYVEPRGGLKGTVKVSGDIKASGNGYFGPAYIGKYGKSRSDYAQFSHINQTGKSNYALTQHKNGATILNSSAKEYIYFRHGDKSVNEVVLAGAPGMFAIKKRLFIRN